MARIGSCGIVLFVATCTIRWCTGIAIAMAGKAVGIKVGSCQREGSIVVVENIVGIARWVAGEAGIAFVNITSYALVTIIRLWIGMAGRTGKFGIILLIGMAVRTAIPDAFVLTTIYRKVLVIVGSKNRRLPIRTGGVTLGTIRCKIRRSMVRIRRIVVLLLVATDTVGGYIRVIISRVATLAVLYVVSFR